jgi:superfamily II DNA or RNA helicase
MAAIARSMLGSPSDIPDRLGELTLRPHQVSAVARLLEILGSFRGALLADAVGLGKTYVALAIAREYRNPMVICPAALRSMWERAFETAGISMPVMSIEALSRGLLPNSAPDLMIVDEAHHLRTPGTRRYEAIAHLARRARTLLLSATPLHNSRRDVTALIALFAGSGVRDWTDASLARVIVRREAVLAGDALPAIDGPHSLRPAADDDCLDAILELPPTIPASDEGEAHALTTISLLHLWTSSRAALVTSVRKLLARGSALRDAVLAGHIPTAAELSSWRFAEESLQLALPLFQAPAPPADPVELLSQIDRFIGSAQRLLAHCRTTADPDAARVELLRAVRHRHAGARIVAFSQYASTIQALGQIMRADPAIALVTADGARIASGRTTREAVLAQFSGDATQVPAVEVIDLLLTTDLMSEGVDLRGASVIVHLDLPWNPARLEQRVGRSRRLGSRHDVVHVYTFVPPAAADRILALQRRLSAKVAKARALVGGSFDPLGVFGGESGSPVIAAERLRSRMRLWASSLDLGDSPSELRVAAVESGSRGWVAVCEINGVARMIGFVGSGIEEDPGRLISLIDDLRDPVTVDIPRRDEALSAIRDWMAAREESEMTNTSMAKRAVLERLSHVVARAPRHRRSAILTRAQRMRTHLVGISGIGAERVMSALAQSPAEDDAWLQALDSFSSTQCSVAEDVAQRARVVALVLLEPVSAATAATPE